MSSTRLRQTAAVVALAALALTGCSNQAGAASIVGDQSVTDRQVADVADEVQTQLAVMKGATYDEKAATATSLTLQTRHLIWQAVAAKEGITVTQGEIDAFVQKLITTEAGGSRQTLLDTLAAQSNVAASQLEPAVHDQLVYDALIAKIAPAATSADEKSKAFTDYMRAFVNQLGVEVAPRFGTWNVFSLGPVPDDLSVPPAVPGDGGGRPVPVPNPAN